jgi:hypothetical protein
MSAGRSAGAAPVLAGIALIIIIIIIIIIKIYENNL